MLSHVVIFTLLKKGLSSVLGHTNIVQILFVDGLRYVVLRPFYRYIVPRYEVFGQLWLPLPKKEICVQ